MSAEADLLRIVLALQMGFVTPEQVKETVSECPEGISAAHLAKRGYLTRKAWEVIENLVAVKIEDYGLKPDMLLASLQIDEETLHILMRLPLEPRIQETLLEWKASAKPAIPDTVVGSFEDGQQTVHDSPSLLPATPEGLRESQGEKYEFKGELGRGGLGRVIEAVDRDFGREVAVKMMLPGQSPEAVERFLLEGRAAGRLTHPNIVSIHEIGVLRQGKDEIPYFTMEKIVGRDLKEIIHSLEEGDEETQRKFNRPRLLRVFQEVCNAMAYSHDHGVIHRDLKPANVMVGEYGEVFVVDWGLAKVLGQKEEESAGITSILEGKPGDTPQLTIDGQVMGTPAYMPPEQAEGRIADIDERSDLYSLGAILYEILTFHPPFEGNTAHEVISKVLSEEVTRPSQRVTRLQVDPESQAVVNEENRATPEPKAYGDPVNQGFENPAPPIPPELDGIVLRALAKKKQDRFPTARELSLEIQSYLEGEKQRERNHCLAKAKVAEGRTLVDALGAMRTELVEAKCLVEKALAGIKDHWPVERKAALWAAQDKVKHLTEETVRTLGRAVAAFQEALGFENHNPGARAAMADLYWDQFLREEEAGSESQMIYFENLVREYNDGQYDARLKGDGTLAVRAREYPCACLTLGRMVSPAELVGGVECGVSSVEKTGVNTGHSTLDTEHFSRCGVLGYHPLSGRSLDGREGTEGIAAHEPAEPIRIKVHGPDCETRPLEGADVWLFRYKPRDRMLIPDFPKGTSCSADCPGFGPGIPLAAVLDKLYSPASPYRPREGLYLGKAPVAGFDIPMGSYLLIVHKQGYHPVCCPVQVDRNQSQSPAITLFREAEVPPGFLQVPKGSFVYQGDKKTHHSGPREIRQVDDFFLARFPVTCGAYVEFLNHVLSADPEQAAGRVPRESENAGYYWPLAPTGPKGEKRFIVPTREWLQTTSEDQRRGARRLSESPVDWEADWPVLSVSWEDMMAFAAWTSSRSGHLFTLPHEVQWEKAARGPDGRSFPWGNGLDATFGNMNQSHEDGMRPCAVDSFPADESPYGVRGLGGNSRDWCLNDPGVYPGWRLVRGGYWSDPGVALYVAARAGYSCTNVYYDNGGRLAWIPRLIRPQKAVLSGESTPSGAQRSRGVS